MPSFSYSKLSKTVNYLQARLGGFSMIAEYVHGNPEYVWFLMYEHTFLRKITHYRPLLRPPLTWRETADHLQSEAHAHYKYNPSIDKRIKLLYLYKSHGTVRYMYSYCRHAFSKIIVTQLCWYSYSSYLFTNTQVAISAWSEKQHPHRYTLVAYWHAIIASAESTGKRSW